MLGSRDVRGFSKTAQLRGLLVAASLDRGGRRTADLAAPAAPSGRMAIIWTQLGANIGSCPSR